MPAKAKGTAKATNSDAKSASHPEPPSTVAERTLQRYHSTNPLSKRVEEAGLSALTPAEKKTYTHARLILPVAHQRVALSAKSEREFWKHVTKESLPIRRLPSSYAWGNDKSGRDIGSYSIAELEARNLKQLRLTALNLLHGQFATKREIAKSKGEQLSEEDISTEKSRRVEMAALKRELYGEITGSLASDPEWDDVIPIANEEPEGALAQIAYPDDYAEATWPSVDPAELTALPPSSAAVSYLRAVMAADELSPRALRLTELVIALNPAHYTVWLYRFKTISHLDLSIPSEITWLNEVALDNLKNYQIWHHRQLLLDRYVPTIASDAAAVKALSRSEADFLAQMLREDTKNYHVWTYRQYLVKKLGMWGHAELGAAQNLIEEDVRNNSAWSHRFFLVFSNPDASTPGVGPTERDVNVPEATIDREASYAKEKIALAPQNQSGWNYLRGVLAKGGRELKSEEEFATQFIKSVGEGGEEVRSSHALDYLADVCREKGDKETARLYLQRLAQKWDPIREGYWNYRATQLE